MFPLLAFHFPLSAGGHFVRKMGIYLHTGAKLGGGGQGAGPVKYFKFLYF
jgi:hypothetical protein